MKDKEAHFIDVAQLRLGHYVFIDLGWMDHPFALNSFKITTPEQIETLRGLGLERIRYAPALSDPEPTPPASISSRPASGAKAGVAAGKAGPTNGSPTAAAGDAQLAGTASASADSDGNAGDIVDADVEADAACGGEDPAAIKAAAEAARLVRRELIAVQRAGLQRCESQFTDATRSYKQIVETMHSRPAAAREQCAAMINGLLGQMAEQNECYVRLLSEKAGEKTSLHSINVTIISLLLGKSMGLDDAAMRDIGTGALLHDLGKMELPDRLRWSDEQFSAAERQIYREHVSNGVALARKMGLSKEVQLIIGQHHEYADGSGYPLKLKGEQIIPSSRIVTLVNQYDILCNPGNPALAVTPHEALSLIYAQTKKQFDPRTLALFIRMMGVYPPGSVVELNDGRFAMVVSVNSSRPLRPHIIIHDSQVPPQEALVVNLETEPALGIRRSLKPLQLPRASFDYLSPRKRLCYFFERGREAGSEGNEE